MNIAKPFTDFLLQGGIAPNEIQELSASIKTEEVAKGTYILKEGEICTYTFYVEKGLCRAFTIDETGKEHIVQFAPEGWYINDRGSVYLQEPAMYFIEAIEPSTIVLVPRDFFLKAVHLSPQFYAINEMALHKHIFQMQKRITLLLGATAEARYMDFIHLYPDLMLRVPQWMIASYLGITPESLSRVRKELANRHKAEKK